MSLAHGQISAAECFTDNVYYATRRVNTDALRFSPTTCTSIE